MASTLRRLAAHSPPAAAIAAAALSFACLAGLWAGGGGEIDLPWAPTLDLRLQFELDGLAALYSLLATGVGLAVFVFAAPYLPAHLAHQDRPASAAPPFWGFLALFMVSMVGLATAQDLILLFVFWDLTAICSYYLIAYDREELESRWAALMALLVTGVSAVALLIGALVLYAAYGTFSLPELFERAEPGGTVTLAAALIAFAAVAKSAQVPLHFWLPRAMSAPTPVSAYLHSAAMVAAGVLLLGRAYPLIADSQLLLDALTLIGALSMVVGGVLALGRDDMKQLLAYSTLSQYGYVVLLYGLGGRAGAVAASFYVVAHAIAKSALFLTAGAVTTATGGRKLLSELGGLASRLPLLAVASAVAAASVAALPLALGFFGDELLFKAAKDSGPLATAFVVGAAGLTLAYLGRFWAGIFLGRGEGAPRVTVPAPMLAPIVALALALVVGGVWPEPVTDLAEAAAASSVGVPVEASTAYHLDARAENLMALGAYALGALLLAAPALTRRLSGWLGALGSRAGPERLYGASFTHLNRLSDRLHELEVRDMRTRVSAVLVPAGLLVVLALVTTPLSGAYTVGELQATDAGLAGALGLSAVAAVAVAVPRDHLTIALLLATLGFVLAAAYAFFGAPDVALVAVVVETLFALLIVGVLALIPREVRRREAALPTPGSRRWRDPLIGVGAGAVAAALAWGAFSRPTPDRSVSAEELRLTDDAHAKDAVTAILADFRGLDTLGEVTVIAVALAGVLALLRKGRLW